MDAAPPASIDAKLLAGACRWVRLLFERWRLTSQTGRGPTGEPSPAAVALAGAPPAAGPLDGAIAATLEEVLHSAPDEAAAFSLLRRVFGLGPIEEQVLLLLVAYQIDGGLQRLRAALSGEQGRLTVALLEELLEPTLAGRLAVTVCLRPLSPLRYFQLVRTGDAGPGPGLSGKAIEAHERVVEFLCGHRGFDERLLPTATLRPPEAPGAGPYPAPLYQDLERAWKLCERSRRPLFLSGADHGGARAVLESLAGVLQRPLLVIDLGRLTALFSEPDAPLQEHLREALLQGALPYLEAHEELSAPLRARLGAVLACYPGPFILGVGTDGGAAWAAAREPVGLRVPAPDVEARRLLWGQHLEAWGVRDAAQWPASTLKDLARRFILGHDAIHAAAAEFATQAQVRPGAGSVFERLCKVARSRQTHQLGRFAQRVECTSRMEDLIAPEAALQTLWSMVLYKRHSGQVLEGWGFGRRLSRGLGLSALFHGPPGTGKTMAASVVADQLDMDLFRVDLSKVTSMWIGESEKQLAELFDQATTGQVVLLFDEADSLFAKRTDVRTSGDRYANLGVNFLLQKMEEYPGVSILTTNKPENLDEAFKRRLRFHVEFTLPDATERQRLWASMIPEECELEGELDLEELAGTYEMGGGSIQNAILRAAFLAVEDGRALGAEQLWSAAEQEYQALGKLLQTRG